MELVFAESETDSVSFPEDEEMKTLISTMKPYDDDDSTGRIFSVKFNPENSNNCMKIYLK